MTLRLIASTNPDDVTRSAPTLPESGGIAPASLTDLLRTGEALVWWDRKLKINWTPIILTELISLAVFVVAGVVVPELWSAPWATLIKPLAVLTLPAALLLIREYFSRSTIALTDQALVSLDWQGIAHRLGLGDILATTRDFRSGGVKLAGRMDSVVVPTALLEATRRALTNQLRVRTTAIAFHAIDDQARLFPPEITRAGNPRHR